MRAAASAAFGHRRFAAAREATPTISAFVSRHLFAQHPSSHHHNNESESHFHRRGRTRRRRPQPPGAFPFTYCHRHDDSRSLFVGGGGFLAGRTARRTTTATKASTFSSSAGKGGSNGDGDESSTTEDATSVPSRSPLRVWEYRAASAPDDVATGVKDRPKRGGEFGGGGATLYEAWTDKAGRTSWRRERAASSTGEGGIGPNDAGSARPPLPLAERLSSFGDRSLSHFLPAGYPATVPPSYLTYAGYCFVASTAGSAAMVLSTQTLLLAVGVGSASAAPMAAALNWVLKDGVGQLGGVLFASRLGRSATGSSIDLDPKRWRMVAALCLDGATLLEILSPLFPGYFLPIASVANVGKNVGFLAASASRAAVHQSLALRNNLGDLTAKAGSQSIAASLAGTALGIGLSHLLGGGGEQMAWSGVVWGFVGLSAVHQFGTFRALSAVELSTLNRHRLHLVLVPFVQKYCKGKVINRGSDGDISEDINSASLCAPTPADVARRESFLPFVSPDDTATWLTIGCSLPELCPGGPNELQKVRRMEGTGKYERYVLSCRRHDGDDGAGGPSGAARGRSWRVRLTFLHGATGIDIIRGMLHAHLIRAWAEGELALSNWVCSSGGSGEGGNNGGGRVCRTDFASGESSTDGMEIVRASHLVMMENIEVLLCDLELGGWKLGTEEVCVESGSGFRLRIEDSP